MRHLMVICALSGVAAPASAEVVRTLSQNSDDGAWSLSVPGWSATLSNANPQEMEAALELRPDGGDAVTTTIDMMGQNLPLLMSVDEVILCADAPEIVVSTADLVQDEANGTFVYRRFVFSPSDGFLGEVSDAASVEARGLLPAAVVAPDLIGLCKK